MKKERLDVLLVKRGFVTSRNKSQRYILAGLVFCNGQKLDKVGVRVPIDSNIVIKERLPYVSRGGLKLEKALTFFKVNLQAKVFLDIGSSTGGFTDCALKHGAKKVYAVDVGYGQLDFSLRTNPSVVVMEKTNFRYVKEEDFPIKPDVAAIDVSFIALKNIFLPLTYVLKPKGEVIALVKPQFEAGKKFVVKGIVKDKEVHFNVLKNFLQMTFAFNFTLKDVTFSPIKGAKGNIEFLAYLKYQKPSSHILDLFDVKFRNVINNAHSSLN